MRLTPPFRTPPDMEVAMLDDLIDALRIIRDRVKDERGELALR